MRPPLFVVVLFALDLALGVIAVLGAAVAASAGLEGIEFVRLGAEANLPAWYSASQLLLVAAIAAVAVWPYATSGKPGARWAFAPSAFFALLSLDEGAQVHERLGDALEGASGAGAGLVTGPWLFVAVPLYAALAWVVWKAIRPLLTGRPAIVWLAIVGGVLFVTSAAGIEALGNLFAGDMMARRVLGVFEEVGEMIAATTFVWAAWALLRAEGVQLAVAAPRHSGDGAALEPRLAVWDEPGVRVASK